MNLRLSRVAPVASLLVLTTSCILTMSFDRYDTNAPIFGVSGTLDGLDPGVTVALVLNGDASNALVMGDGPFVFPPSLVDGASWTVAVESAPPTMTCGSASGIVAKADVTGAAIHCVSTDATLSGLSISAAAIHPTFAPTTPHYTADPVRVGPLLAPTTTTTVTATAARAGATITVENGAVASGTPSPPIALAPGANTLHVAVRASSGASLVYTIDVTGVPDDYLKASNPHVNDSFGTAVAMSGDGSTVAVGAPAEASNATGIDGDQTPGTKGGQGAVYVFVRTGAAWSQQAYVKASNTDYGAFGSAVALSYDGSTLAVGAIEESSVGVGVDGNQAPGGPAAAGATYVFTRQGTTWSQQAYFKASNPAAFASFGAALTLSGDGNTLAVGADGEGSSATGVDGSQTQDPSTSDSGAAYVFSRSGAAWTQQAYVKASNTGANDHFGAALALSGDGNSLVVGAYGEASGAGGIDGNQNDDSKPSAGAAYVFVRAGASWAQQAYVKSASPTSDAAFGLLVALSQDGSTLAVGAGGEDSSAGVAYVFSRASTTWSQQARIAAAVRQSGAGFGAALALSSDGSTLLVGAAAENSNALYLNGDPNNTAAPGSGAAYLFRRAGSAWSQRFYMKASNTRALAQFGWSVALSGDGGSVAVGSLGESSGAKGVNGDQTDSSTLNSGATYVF